ncbi:MAG: hypothetical protein ABIH23_29790 [bacterium]
MCDAPCTGSFVFTMDMDWAPPDVIEDALGVFDEYSIRCTLFLTNRLTGIGLQKHELSVHPHCTDLSAMENTLLDSLKIVPDAVGIRWHSLFHTQRLFPIYAAHGIRYESNVMMYNVSGISPYRLTPRIWEFPIFFMDNVHLWMSNDVQHPFEPACLRLNSEGLKIFAFHPMHIFLNTDRLDRYEAAKVDYHNPVRLREHIHPETSGTGIRVLLKRLLAFVHEQNIRTMTLREIVDTLD